MADKDVREELAELAEAVRELRDREVADTIRELRGEIGKLRAERAGHHCHGCTCIHWHYTPAVTYPLTTTPCYQVNTCGSSTSVVSGASYVATNAAAGVNSTYALTSGN